MFQESLVESTSMLRTKSRWPVMSAVAAQAIVLAACIAVPLINPEALSLASMKVSEFPLPPVPKPPAPPKPVHVEAAVTSSNTPSLPAPETYTPSLIPTTHASMEPVGDAPTISSIHMGDEAGPVSIGVAGPAGPHIIVATPAAAPAHTGAQHVSSGVSAGLLLEPIRPTYPAIARTTRTEGTVVVHAVISKSGQVERAEIISGSPMLSGAALEAVRNARYRPYLLSGEPTEVETTFSIVFKLG